MSGTLVPMSTPDASTAARELNRARWGGQVINRAIATLASRRNELDAQQLAELDAIANGEPDGDGDVDGDR